jgi:hypothetical protein
MKIRLNLRVLTLSLLLKKARNHEYECFPVSFLQDGIPCGKIAGMNPMEYPSKLNEPSVLDVLKEKLRFRKSEKPNSPKTTLIPESKAQKGNPKSKFSFPWRSLIAIATALVGQRFLEPASRNLEFAVLFYALGILFLIYAIIAREWQIPEISLDDPKPIPLEVKRNPFLISLPFILLAFFLFGGNQFNLLNVTFWVIAIIFSVWALWIKPSHRKSFKERFHELKSCHLTIHVSPWTLLVVVVVVLILFFRVYQLNQVPGEMFSDHAEKLLDVSDVLHGQFSIFFPRNTGREAIQFYLTAVISLVAGTGLSFISLKIGTVLIGLLTLPFIYLLGKEIGNRWIGLMAMFMAGIAYWPNVISRVGLRFPLYPLFVAPTLYFLIRGIRYSKRNELILSGIFLGLGLHGYSPFRIVPFVVAAAYLIFILHRSSKGRRKPMLWGIALVAFISFVVFLPLFRYFLSNPGMFNLRVISRITGSEQALSGNPMFIFLSNLWKAWIMFLVDNGSIWVHSVTGRPALDVIMAAFYVIGTVVLFARYLKKKNWVDLFLLLSVPLLMLPSILSLAFPDENPSLNRTAGAMIPVFIICAFGFVTAIRSLWLGMSTWKGKTAVVLFTGGVLIGTIAANYKLVFQDYKNQFLAGAWNTSDIGRVIRGFVDTIGTEDTAYVVPYPYWVDTRLVGINAGFPNKDYALNPEGFAGTLAIEKPKLFILDTEDQVNLKLLQSLYPKGVLYTYKDEYPGKDFWMLMVPAN